MVEFDKLDKTFASDLYLIHKLSPSARVCISDKDQLLMFYISHKRPYKIASVLGRISLDERHFLSEYRETF